MPWSEVVPVWDEEAEIKAQDTKSNTQTFGRK
jgi:hypothetical protein